MRVAMVGAFGLQPKGTMAVRALPLARALTERGHAVSMFLPPWSYPDDAGRTWEQDGVQIANTAIVPRWLIAPRLAAQARAWRPDIIHFFKPKAYAGLAAWICWQLRLGSSAPRLVVDSDDWEGAGGWNEIENYPWAYKLFFNWQEKWGMRHNDALTVASRGLETLAWSRGVSPRQVYYLPYGVNPFARRDLAQRDAVRTELRLNREPVMLLYTRFFEFGVQRLVEILARVAELVPDARLLVVGKGLFGEEQELTRLAAAHGLDGRIKGVGWVETARLPGLFAAADIALYPFDDTLVNRTKCIVKLGDLLAAGLPVVADAVGQAQEYIAHNETGLLTRPGSVEDFACAAARLLRDGELRMRLGAASAARMAREYSWDRLAAVAEEAYGHPMRP